MRTSTWAPWTDPSLSGDKNTPAGDEAELLRHSLEGVTPLKDSGKIEPKPSSRPAIVRPNLPAASLPDILSDSGAGETALTEYLSNGLSRDTLRKLRRGHIPVEDSLDLHGLDAERARRLLQTFLDESRQHGVRCVRIIHGKGRNPDGSEGKLKILSRHWLAQSPLVLAFCEPAQAEGGGGAVLVLLSGKR